jgi:aerobic C4-dicarboxylate transport protein
LLKKLYVQVLIGILIGIVLGAAWPQAGIAMKPIGDAFISLIRAVVPVIIFATVVVGFKVRFSANLGASHE